MTYKTFDPKNVISPKKNVKNVRVIFKNQEYSIAKIEWNGNDQMAIRWNISENERYDQDKINGIKKCLGEPNSRGVPTWFILPDDLSKTLKDLNKE